MQERAGEAFYTNLYLGPYQFRVIACNNDGVWNETGTVLRFVVLPAFDQTVTFKILCGLALLAALWSVYLLRLKQATARIRQRLGARLEERERIARELHDTLLQSFQGLLLRFQAALTCCQAALMKQRRSSITRSSKEVRRPSSRAGTPFRGCVGQSSSPTISPTRSDKLFGMNSP